MDAIVLPFFRMKDRSKIPNLIQEVNHGKLVSREVVVILCVFGTRMDENESDGISYTIKRCGIASF